MRSAIPNRSAPQRVPRCAGWEELVTATLGIRKLVQFAVAPVRQVWLGMHFSYGCFEGTVLALILIAQLRWKMRGNTSGKHEGCQCKSEE